MKIQILQWTRKPVVVWVFVRCASFLLVFARLALESNLPLARISVQYAPVDWAFDERSGDDTPDGGRRSENYGQTDGWMAG